MDLTMETEKAEVKGARKRKSATITRIIQNEVQENTEINETKREIQQTNSFQKLENHITKKLKLISKTEDTLKEPAEKVTLITRSLGYSSSIRDELEQNSLLNSSVINGPPFTCTICKSWFYLGNKLKMHYVINHNRFHCEICGILFDTKDEKDIHLESIHKIIQCEICQDDINRFDIWFHYEQDHDAISCNYCSNILYPKSCHQDHIRKYHRIIESYEESGPLGIFKVGDMSFTCNLCLKTRDTDTFFGHMKSYHKIDTTQLMTISMRHSLNLTVDGTTLEERSTDINAIEEIVPIENPRKTLKTSCKGCKILFDDKIQSRFHQVYCLQKVQCLYCYAVFEDTIFRSTHYKKKHSSFKCKYECLNIDVETEEQLNEHLLNIHNFINCRYCEETLPNDKFDDHLLNKHNYKVIVMENFTDSLFEVTKVEKDHLVLCCLCEKNITSLTDNITNIFDHFYINHSVSIKKINRLVTPKPMLSDYDNFYKEIDTSIEHENEHPNSENEFSEDSQESNNKENKLTNKTENPHNIKLKIETDIDYDNVETCIDYENEDDILFNCDVCETNNISLLDYVIHLKDKYRISTSFNEFECKICCDILLSRDDLNKHIIEMHSVDMFAVDNYECGCNEKPYICFAKQHVLENHNIEEEKHHVNVLGYKCRFCDIFFWNREEQNDHEIQEHLEKKQIDFIKCPICLSLFGNLFSLKQHVEDDHIDYAKYSKVSFKCRLCTTMYPNISTLREHFYIYHPLMKLYYCPYPNCFKPYKMSKNLKNHMKKPHGNMQNENFDLRPCELCGMNLKSLRAMSVHTVTKHRREKLGFACKICKERFQTVEQRKLHVTTVHPGKQEYNCSECDKSFSSKSGLNGHRHMIHSPQQQFKCPYCQKEFLRKDTYVEHLLIHTGPKHQCPHCPKSFTQRSNLIRHIRIHTGEKPYACGYCNKTFSDQGARRSHERMHTAEEHCQCPECGKRFTKWQKLKYHMKIHTGEGLLGCDICGKKFTNSYGLRVHREVHTRENEFACECGRTYSTEKYLQKHKEYMHGTERKKFTCPICYKQLNARTRTAQEDHILTHTNKRFMCKVCNKASYTKRTARKHIILKHNLNREQINDNIHEMQETEQDSSVNLHELLNEHNMLQIDIIELENLNETKDVQIKSEPLSEDDIADFEDDNEPSDDEKDEDFVIQGVKKKVERTKKSAQRSSPRTRNLPKLYNYDFSDEDD